MHEYDKPATPPRPSSQPPKTSRIERHFTPSGGRDEIVIVRFEPAE
ncbi:hypothetical protein [Actinoplanes palleronii]|nr:hypothetical protein [Actinoplanes palleronii]